MLDWWLGAVCVCGVMMDEMHLCICFCWIVEMNFALFINNSFLTLFVYIDNDLYINCCSLLTFIRLKK